MQARVITQNDPLNMRDYPVTGTIITTIPKGAIVDIGIGPSPVAGWSMVSYGGFDGYASDQYLQKFNGPEPPPPPLPRPAPAPPAPPPPQPTPGPSPRPIEPIPPTPEPTPYVAPNHTALYVGIGVAAVAALGALGLWLAKRR